MPQSDIIVVERLVKRYGARLAVRGVSFAVKEGEIVGLLGPNGSGKSTILRILTGYLRSSSGSVRIGGVDVAEHSLAVRNYVGYVPEDAPLYDWMRVGEFLKFMAEIKGVPGRAARSVVASACAQLDLERVVGLPVGKLSRGYRQRVAIAQALLNDPPILVFDEPTNALDAYQVIGIRELIRSLAGQRTVLVASHVLTEIEKVASRIMILRDGELLTADAMSEASRAPRFRLRIVGPRQAVLSVLRNVAGVVAADVAAGSADSGDAATYLVEEKPDLEHVFLDLTQRTAEARAA
jgi:ABC-2 type transport system ATP-binding protein